MRSDFIGMTRHSFDHKFSYLSNHDLIIHATYMKIDDDLSLIFPCNFNCNSSVFASISSKIFHRILVPKLSGMFKNLFNELLHSLNNFFLY